MGKKQVIETIAHYTFTGEGCIAVIEGSAMYNAEKTRFTFDTTNKRAMLLYMESLITDEMFEALKMVDGLTDIINDYTNDDGDMNGLNTVIPKEFYVEADKQINDEKRITKAKEIREQIKALASVLAELESGE